LGEGGAGFVRAILRREAKTKKKKKKGRKNAKLRGGNVCTSKRKAR